MSNERRPILCPFKKIIEREYSGKTGVTTINERFAPCAKERCIAYTTASARELRSTSEGLCTD